MRMADPRPIGYWLKLVDRLIDDRFVASLEEHGVTRRQWQLLNVLSRGSATIGQLDAAVAPFLDADREESSASHIAELVESGWVTEATGVYSISDRGRDAHTRLAAVVTDFRDVMAKTISDQEYAATLNVLERMARNLGWNG